MLTIKEIALKQQVHELKRAERLKTRRKAGGRGLLLRGKRNALGSESD